MVLVISGKNYAAERLLEEARLLGVGLKIVKAEDLFKKDFKIRIDGYQALYIRNPYINGGAAALPKIISLAKKFKASKKRVIDAVIAKGELGLGKWADCQKLEKAGLQIPRTHILSHCPLPTIRYPLILKWVYGFKGRHTFYIKNQKQLDQTAKKYPASELMLQEFINAKYEYKVITVGYKALPVILRFAINPGNHRPDFRNYSILCHCEEPGVHPRGDEAISVLKRLPRPGILKLKNAGSRNGIEKIQSLVKLAEQSSALLKRELSKVDILESRGKFYILEANRFPGLKSFEQLTGYNVAGEFLKYVIY